MSKSFETEKKEPGPNLFNQLKLNETGGGQKFIFGNSLNNGIQFRNYLFRERLKNAKNLFKTNLMSHYGCINAIEFSNCGKYLISGGDDKRILLWDVEKSIANYEKPIPMDKEHQSNIFCLGFNTDNSRIFSGGNDEMVMIHDFETRKVVDVHIHLKPVYGLSVNPENDNKFATACEDGKITIFDQRKSAAVAQFGKFGSRQASFHGVQFHPHDGNYLVTANTRKGAAFWDLRTTTKPIFQYGGEDNQQSCMSVRFSSNGKLVLALRRRLPPILYNTFSETPICQFYHPDYYNSCTMKSCCFAGVDDEFVLSGSDDFNLYMWKVGDVDLDITNQWIEKTHLVLYGHRSIVNQVRYNSDKCLIASSGVEKIVKLWSPFKQKDWTGSLTEEVLCSDNPREVFTHDAYVSLVNQNMSHDYSNQNTDEDSRMMAFFDSLVQQEIEGWNTQSSEDQQCTSSSSEAQSSRQNTSDDSDEDGGVNFYPHTRERGRRGTSSSSTIKPQRNKYANRIAYLIATKRNTLRRLALKGAKNSSRRRNQNMNAKTKRKNHGMNGILNQRGQRTSRSNSSTIKRNGRLPTTSFRNRNSRGVDENDNLRANRNKRYESGYKSLRRKHRSRRSFDPSDSSSDNDDTDDKLNFDSRPNLAIPSTSTGITSSSRDVINRLRLQEQLLDSEDSDEPQAPAAASIPEQPTETAPVKQNGVILEKIESERNIEPAASSTATSTSSLEINNSETIQNINQSVDIQSSTSSSNNRKRTNNNLESVYSSHSNSRLSNSSCLEEDSGESLDCFISNKRIKLNNNLNDANSGDDNNETTNNRTPDRLVDCNTVPPDSGISLGPSSLITPGSNNNNYNDCCNINNSNNSSNNINNNDKFSIKLFQQKISRVRRNYRKHFSESD